MVRVVSKKIRDGRLFDKKLTVHDISDEYSFTAMDERGNIIDDLREKDVETVIPKLKSLVKVLYGEHKGHVGTLLDRNKQKNQVQIQLLDTFEIITVTQDDCAQYVEKKWL